MNFIEELDRAMANNGGKIPKSFIDMYLNSPRTRVVHVRPTPNTRVCVITLTTGHDLVGYAQVIDADNDVESIGQEVAYDNAKEEIWRVFGAIGKVL